MINLFKSSIDTVKEISKLLKDIDQGAQEAVASVKRNGVILDEYKARVVKKKS